VLRIDSDPERAGYSYAYVSDYMLFDRPVSFARNGTYAEAALREIGSPSRVGAYLQGKSIRGVSEADFAAIVSAGFTETLSPTDRIPLALDSYQIDEEASEFLYAPPAESMRRIEQVLLNRKFREASFRWHVCEAYDSRCALTGLRIINGGGKAEVQAAHIWSVASGGPDVVQNGLALSGTVHWLFDRHAKQLDRIHLPKDPKLWPHRGYVARHREVFSSA
jgi:putative restriction endonuclease